MSSVLTDDGRAALVRDLAGLLGDRCTTNATQLEHHGHGESWHAPGAPDVVVFPLSTEEVSAVVRAAARHGAPIVPFGAGSSLEGHVNPIHGGVSLDLSRMNRVLRVSAEDLDATVEAGVTHRQLNKALANTGCAFWVDPGADATMGGMAATRASGTTAVRYGTMRDAVLGLTVVLADGRVIRTGGRARKSSAGYDLTRLFVGSEGTLGVITEVTVRLYGQPEAVSAAVCAFESIDGAVRAVIQTIQFGIPVARIELLDEVQIDAVNRYSKLSYAAKPTLLFEFHATSAAGASEHAAAVQEIAAEHGGSGFRVGHDDRGPGDAVGRAPQHLLRRAGDAAGRQGVGERRVRADLGARRVHRRDQAGSRGIERLRAARRPRRRRQFPPELHPRSRRPGAGGGGEGAERAAGAAGPPARRHLHRRARHRARQAAVPARRARRGRGGGDAGAEAGARPGGADESGKIFAN